VSSVPVHELLLEGEQLLRRVRALLTMMGAVASPAAQAMVSVVTVLEEILAWTASHAAQLSAEDVALARRSLKTMRDALDAGAAAVCSLRLHRARGERA
jgi:hypothetical protein